MSSLPWSSAINSSTLCQKIMHVIILIAWQSIQNWRGCTSLFWFLLLLTDLERKRDRKRDQNILFIAWFPHVIYWSDSSYNEGTYKNRRRWEYCQVVMRFHDLVNTKLIAHEASQWEATWSNWPAWRFHIFMRNNSYQWFYLNKRMS